MEGLELEIEGMSCGACVSAVNSALARLPRGSIVESHVEVGSATLRFRPSEVSLSSIVEGA